MTCSIDKVKIILVISAFSLLQNIFLDAYGQPVNWTFQVKRTSANNATVYFLASIEQGWHLYSQALPKDGPLGTTFTIATSNSIELLGKVNEPKPIVKYEKYFDMTLSYFENAVVFQQEIRLKDQKPIVSGTIQYVACSDQICLAPQTVTFSVPIK